jgi:ribosomal protein S12 methylthiotransferase
MGRRYTGDDLRRLFKRIREFDPGAVLRSTAIVGFPGETPDAFDRLLDFVEEIRFDHLGVFTYSDAEDLPSHGLPDPVPASTAEHRYDEVMSLQRGISFEKNEERIGRIYPVLVDEAVEPGLYAGRGPFQAPEVDGLIDIQAGEGDGGPVKIGGFASVRITGALEYDLTGEPA